MFLDPYFTTRNDRVVISAQQGSDFAKRVAQDFNPIHDVDNRRFCVPGDLLFSLALNTYGLSRKMSVRFAGMVDADKPLIFPKHEEGVIDIKDDDDKTYMHVEHSGETLHDPDILERFSREYVKFSGQNFPFIMVPLMEEYQVMFNPKRPFVIYERMAFELDSINVHEPTLELADRIMDIKGRRGDIHFRFNVMSEGKVAGEGTKTLIVSGLQPYDDTIMKSFIEKFYEAKAAFNSKTDLAS